MRFRLFSLLVLTLLAAATLISAARADGAPGTAYYANGDTAVAADECNPGDVCATITLAGGDTIKVLTGGSGRCNPYVMTFMRYHAELLDRVWSTPTDRNPDTSGGFGGPKCGAFRNTHMMVDAGIIDMGIFQKQDGAVFVQFFGGSATPVKP